MNPLSMSLPNMQGDDAQQIERYNAFRSFEKALTDEKINTFLSKQILSEMNKESCSNLEGCFRLIGSVLKKHADDLDVKQVTDLVKQTCESSEQKVWIFRSMTQDLMWANGHRNLLSSLCELINSDINDESILENSPYYQAWLKGKTPSE